MASQVFSGTKNFSYTNNTGQNARVIINFMRSLRTRTVRRGGAIVDIGLDIPANAVSEEITTTEELTLNWAGVSTQYRTTEAESRSSSISPGDAIPCFIGKNLGFFACNIAVGPNGQAPAIGANGAVLLQTPNNVGRQLIPQGGVALPIEILLASGQTFSATCGIYNILVIPENG